MSLNLDPIKDKFMSVFRKRNENSLQPAEVSGAFASSPVRPSLSVNSLSRISDRLQRFSQGDDLRRLSFVVSYALCAWFIADMLALMVEKYLPSPPVSILATRMHGGAHVSSPYDYDIIANRNLFSSKEPKKNGNEVDLEAEPVPTTLPFQLVGTVIFKNPARSMAALQDKSESKVYPIRMGDEIPDRIQVLSVEPRRVVFINLQAHRKEFVEIPEDPSIKISTGSSRTSSNAGAAPSGDETHYSFSHSEIESQLGNLGNLLTQARAVPETRGGQMIGFRLVEIQPGSFYEKAGMKKLDVIKSINGEKITDPAKAMAMLGELKNMNSLDLGIERNGKDLNLNYDLHH